MGTSHPSNRREEAFFRRKFNLCSFNFFLPSTCIIDFFFRSGEFRADIVLIGHIRCMYNIRYQSLIAIMNCDFVTCSVYH
jgi:hypothetical protein